VKKSLVHLADGRELLFFDHDSTAARTDRSDVKDARDLEPASTAPEIRRPRSGTTRSSTSG
jgi:hypothetical protein